MTTMTRTTSDTTTTPMVNGLDPMALRGLVDAVTEQAGKGQTHWRVTSTWRGGTRTDHKVDGFTMGGQTVDRRFMMKIDEPEELGGTNRYANPQEHLMAALNACMMVGYAAVSAMMGIHLTRLEVDIEGDIDLRGFLAIDASVPPGYRRLHQTVRIAGDGTPEQFEKLHAIVQATSPNYHNLTHPITVDSTLIVE